MNKISFYSVRNSFLLFLTAFIWGIAFVAQSVGMDHCGPFTFNAARSLIGGTVLLPLIWWQKHRKRKNELSEALENSCGGTVRTDNPGNENRLQKAQAASGRPGRATWIGGICCGLALGTASMFQQYGIMYTTVGRAGFITALYIIIVPIMGLFFGKKVRSLVWGGAVIAAVGMYLLCVSEHSALNPGDLLVFVSSVIFAVHILVIDHFSAEADGVQMSCVQFFTMGIGCTIGAFLFETPTLAGLLAGIVPILYAGVMSCGVAYTLQIIGQKDMDPTVASLILSLESVISVLAGWVLLGQALSGKELFGCALVFAAVILVQLPEKRSV